MIAQIEEMGKVLLEVVDLHQKTQEDLKELNSYKQNRSTLLKEVADKEKESKDWDGKLQALKAEHSRFKQSHQEYKDKQISNTRIELEEQRAGLVRDYQRDMKELEQEKEKLLKVVGELKKERDELHVMLEGLKAKRQTILEGLRA